MFSSPGNQARPRESLVAGDGHSSKVLSVDYRMPLPKLIFRPLLMTLSRSTKAVR